MASNFIVVDGVKYVLDADGRTLRTKEDIQRRIAGVNVVLAEFHNRWDAELARLNALLGYFPGE